MRAGAFNRRITIQRLVETEDNYGQPIKTWPVLVSNLPAQVLPFRGHERFQTQKFDAENIKRFRVRFRQDLSTKYRIVFEDNLFDIHRIDEVGFRLATEIIASAHVN
jgi:SPP1 family predicted phage head-tail adaptor